MTKKLHLTCSVQYVDTPDAMHLSKVNSPPRVGNLSSNRDGAIFMNSWHVNSINSFTSFVSVNFSICVGCYLAGWFPYIQNLLKTFRYLLIIHLATFNDQFDLENASIEITELLSPLANDLFIGLK